MSTKKGHILALAYPDVFVRRTEAKYNYALSKIGIVNDGAVCAGHAALVLIHGETGELHYADFGRYITPMGFGRARTELTDPDVKIKFKAEFDTNGEIVNLEEIIKFIEGQPELTHGYGRLCVGLFRNVVFEKALAFIQNSSKKGSIHYGPWDSKGTNCSRFVLSAIWQSSQSRLYKFKMASRIFPTPMPLDVVMSAKKGDAYLCENHKVEKFSLGQWKIWMHLWKLPKKKLKMAEREEWQYPGGTWLGGVGDGSWFSLEPSDEKDVYYINRFSAKGELIFKLKFRCLGDFNPDNQYEFTYDCNALFCYVIQNGIKLKFDRVKQLSRDLNLAEGSALLSS